MYDTFAQDYDHFVNWQGRLAYEMPFLLDQLKSVVGSQPLHVLDSACGTGMHAIALAQQGFAVSGADLSSPMVEKARQNARQAGLQIRFETAGFGSLAKQFGTSAFHAVLCLGNSLPHITTTKGLDEALSDFAACLKPGGLLFLQNRNFDAVMAKKDRWQEPQSAQDGKQEWVFYRFYDFESNGLIRFNIVTLKRSAGGEWISQVTSTLLMPQLHQDLVNALHKAGFESIQAFGSMQGEPFNPQVSGNLILAAFRRQ